MPKPEHLKLSISKQKWADLSRWAVKDGSKIDATRFYKSASDRTWESISTPRLKFAEAAKCFLDDESTRGTRPSSIHAYAAEINKFIKWADASNITISIDESKLKKAFFEYDRYIFDIWHTQRTITRHTARGSMNKVAKALTHILGIEKEKHLKNFSRVIKLAKKGRSRRTVGHEAEKQNLEDAAALGRFCVDVANAITMDAATGPLPFNLNYSAKEGDQKSIAIPLGISDMLESKHQSSITNALKESKPNPINSSNFRQCLVRIKLLAELVIFTYQTGMNVSQALKIERKSLSYKLQGNNDWRVTLLKARKQGNVSFLIYREYKPWLKKLVKFVEQTHPDSPFLFPLERSEASSRGTVNYEQLTKLLRRAEIPWVPPKKGRKTRANFLDRKTGDPSISAEMMQHTKEVFKEHYNKPSQQQAMSALTVFWRENPVSLISSGCNGIAEPVENKPSDVAPPNCNNESGCLWCKSHRDIESEDYVWSLATYRHLKLFEASQPIKREIPADLVVARLTEKLEAFRQLNAKSNEWVEEALLRIEEGRFHRNWEGILNFWGL